MRSKVIDSIAAFVAPGGKLVVVCRAREDDDKPDQLPWPLSRKELSRFEEDGLEQTYFDEIWDEEEEQTRFVVEYQLKKD